MPPRRTKKPAAVSSSLPPCPSKSYAQSPKTNVNEDLDTQTENSSNECSTANFGSAESIDPALLDEEDTLVQSEDTSATPSRESLREIQGRGAYAAGGGGYNSLKSFNGQVYSGMAVGGSHTWNYDQGVWKETKEEPDLWKIEYETTKRRAKKAPKGSGAPIGTEYHWLIVAHQYVKKVDANTYETRLVGSKYKLAHKGASSNSWSTPTVKAQRERETELLEDAKRRVQGLPPVLAGEKVKVEKREKGQQKLDALFTKAAESKEDGVRGTKRKRNEGDEGE